MTPIELYELVKPLIGTEWEPDGLTFNGAVWIHADIARSEDGYGAAFPVPAARAMWAESIMDRLWKWSETRNKNREVCFRSWDDDTVRVGQMNYDDFHEIASGPTRLHALVAAAKEVKK